MKENAHQTTKSEPTPGFSPEIISRPIIERMVGGDHDAFDKIYVHSVAPLTNFLALLLHSREDAKDKVQDVFGELWDNRSKIDPSKNLKGYLYTIAKRAAYKHMEKRGLDQKYYNYSIVSTPDFPVEPDEEFMTAELAVMINIYINGMPAQRKRVYEMSRNNGMSDKQIAEELSISVETVRSHIKVALKGIREVTTLCMLLFFS